LAYLATSLSLEIPDEGKVRDLLAQATRMYLSVWEDCTIIHIDCLSENLEAALRVASDIVQDPLLTGIRIDPTKRTMDLRGRAARDDAEAAGRDAVLRALFGSRGYGTTAFGTEGSLRSLGKKEVSDYRRRFFTRSGLFFSVGSDLEGDHVRALLEKYFSRFQDSGPPDVPPQRPELPEDRDLLLVRDTKQTYVGRAFVLPAPSPSTFARTLLLETLLSRGPGSRLWELRTTGKLAYNVNAGTIWTRTAGILEAYLETEASKAERASAAMDEVLKDLREQGPSDDEFEAAKTLAAAQFLRSVETKPVRTRMAGTFEVLGLGHEFLSGIFEAIDRVTRADLLSFIEDVLGPDKALRIAIGPGSADPHPER
jgi:zinc protease